MPSTQCVLRAAGGIATIILGVVACASTQGTASGASGESGVTSEQIVSDHDAVERMSAGYCDRIDSCNGIGPGEAYRTRDECMSRMRTRMSKRVDASRCKGAVGEIGVARCEKSLELGECDEPGQTRIRHSHIRVVPAQCDVDTMCR